MQTVANDVEATGRVGLRTDGDVVTESGFSSASSEDSLPGSLRLVTLFGRGSLSLLRGS